MEVVSTILSKENLSEVILQSLDPESRRNLISRFVLRDPDREILLRKEAGEQGDCAHTNTQGDSAHTNTQGDSAHTNTQGESREECLVSGESCHNENGLVSQKPSEKEQGRISEESCEERQYLISEESLEMERGLISEKSCEEECRVVSEESSEGEHDLVSEESSEKGVDLVPEAMEYHNSVNTTGEDDIALEIEENTDTAKHDCIISHNSNTILHENQLNKDLSYDYNESEEDFVDGTENVESESEKEDVKEIYSTSDTNAFTENLSNTDISETEVDEDDADDWESDWDDVEVNEYEFLECEEDEYKVETFAGSFVVAV